MATITSIVYRPDHVTAKPEDHFSRLSLEHGQLITGMVSKATAKVTSRPAAEHHEPGSAD